MKLKVKPPPPAFKKISIRVPLFEWERTQRGIAAQWKEERLGFSPLSDNMTVRIALAKAWMCDFSHPQEKLQDVLSLTSASKTNKARR